MRGTSNQAWRQALQVSCHFLEVDKHACFDPKISINLKVNQLMALKYACIFFWIVGFIKLTLLCFGFSLDSECWHWTFCSRSLPPSAGMLLSFDVPVHMGKDGKPINRFLASRGRNFQQMLVALIHEVSCCWLFFAFPNYYTSFPALLSLLFMLIGC